MTREGDLLRGKWRLIKLLDVGGAAAVYRAEHRNGRPVAVKILHPELAYCDEAKARFLREGYLANRIRHRGVVAVYDDDIAEDGSPFMVLELLEGESIEARLARKGRGLGVMEVVAIADQLLDVLAALHEHGIIHRDIKPSNLFLTKSGQVKLLDFGVARWRDKSTPALTLHDATIGTPAFMPPEQALGRSEQVGARADQWAVAATMVSLLTAEPVHRATTVNEALLAAMTKQVPPVRELVPGLSEGLASVIDRALSFDPQGRWADVRTMQRALREAYSAWLSSVDTTRVARRKPRTSLLQLGLAAILVILPMAFIAVLALALSKRGTEPVQPAVCVESQAGGIIVGHTMVEASLQANLERANLDQAGIERADTIADRKEPSRRLGAVPPGFASEEPP